MAPMDRTVKRWGTVLVVPDGVDEGHGRYPAADVLAIAGAVNVLCPQQKMKAPPTEACLCLSK